ncbi:hypothetical protein ISCGN_005208 [Ixodes scapularis]
MHLAPSESHYRNKLRIKGTPLKPSLVLKIMLATWQLSGALSEIAGKTVSRSPEMFFETVRDNAKRSRLSVFASCLKRRKSRFRHFVAPAAPPTKQSANGVFATNKGRVSLAIKAQKEPKIGPRKRDPNPTSSCRSISGPTLADPSEKVIRAAAGSQKEMRSVKFLW